MANTVNDTASSFYDFQKQLAPDGKGFLPVAEVLAQINAPLQDGPITASNAKMNHRITVRVAEPTVTTLKFDQGTLRSKATTEQREDEIGMFGVSNSIDNKHKKVWGSMFDQFRARQDRPFISAMSKKVALYFAYGEGSGTQSAGAQDEAGFTGLAPRMSTLNAPAPGTAGSQVWSKGSVTGGDGTSIYVVDWNADMGVHWIYPESDAAGGLEVKNYENVPVNDADGNQLFASVSEYIWAIGLAVEDPNHIGRLANIDVSDANLGGLATQGLIINGLVDVLSYMPDPIGFQRCLYVHSRVIAAWWKQLNDKAAPQQISRGEYLNKPTLMFDGYPIRRLDQLSIAEGTVS